MCHNDSHNRMLNILREVFVEIDSDNLITYASENCSTLWGYTQKELVGRNVNTVLPAITPKLNPVKSMKSSIITNTRSVIPVDLSYALIIDTDGNLKGYTISLIDISSYIQFDNHEQVVNQMFERSRDIIYRTELNPTFRFTYLSPSIKEILGYTAEEHITNSMLPFNIVHPDDRDILIKKINNDIDFSKPIPTRYQHKNGYYVWLDDYCMPIFDDNGNLIALEGFSRDITEKKELEFKLERLSYYDALTGAYNKHFFEKQISILDSEIDTSIGIIFCDLDNLKITNDTLGHATGDKLIVKTFNFLKDIFVDNSLIARIGGDEFVVIVKDSSLYKIKELYSDLCNTIEQQNKYNEDLKVEVSIGYSFSETSTNVIRNYIDIADKNMYKAKQKKKKPSSL